MLSVGYKARDQKNIKNKIVRGRGGEYRAGRGRAIQRVGKPWIHRNGSYTRALFLIYSHPLPCLGSAWSPLLVSFSAAHQAPAGSG